MKKITTREFIERARKIHGDKYDYSKVEYKGTHDKVCIICPIHGEFWQAPHEHLISKGCRKCANSKPKKRAICTTNEEFIKKAKMIHGDKYDYSKVEYKGSHIKVCIICPIHGEFWQIPYSHLRGCGCSKCGHHKPKKRKISTSKEFIEKAKKIHGNKYDYSKVEYKGFRKKVCIICHEKDENDVEHGEFWQTPDLHLNGCGCLKCYNKYKRGKSRQHNTKWFIEESRKIHGDKYDYSKSEYKTLFTDICIICPIHGEFWQKPVNHINAKHGCPKCGGTNKLTTEHFIEQARKIHGDKYDYSKVEYKGNKTKVNIICPMHGEFWQKPNSHLLGHGCPKCKSSHLEREFRLFLEKNNIEYEEQKTFEWLKYKQIQFLDFYLPKYNIAIECQGEQHFKKSGWGKGNNGEKVIKRDLNKQKLCHEHGIKILYYSNLDIEYPYQVFEDKNELLLEIQK